MAASIAEAYMLILRPVPILGEAWAIPFNGQITLDEWKWGLTPATDQRSQSPAIAPARLKARAGRRAAAATRRWRRGRSWLDRRRRSTATG